MKIIQFQNYSKLLDDLKRKMPLIIAIDGNTGTGKTNLSYRIGAELIKSVINLDDFIIPQQGCFIDVVEFSRLQRRLACLKSFIIEGVCLLDVLNKLSLEQDILIYCREISENTNIWHDEECLDISNHDKYQTKLKEMRGLEADIINYHYNFKPLQNADYVYEIINQLKA